MKKIKLIIAVTVLATILSACNLPGATSVIPTAVSGIQVIPATETPVQFDTATMPAVETVTSQPTIMAPPPTQVPASGPAVIIEQVHMVNQQDGWGWAIRNGSMNQLLRTSDGGQTWKDVSPQGEFVYYGSFFLDSNNAWLPYYNGNSNSGGILRTTNGGQTWENLPTNENIQNAWIEFTSPQDGVAEIAGVGAGNLYLNYLQTLDGGETWNPIRITPPSPEGGLPPGTIHLCNICGDNFYYDQSRVMITYGEMANEPQGKVRVSISTDLGKNWKNLDLDMPDSKYIGGSVAPLSPMFFGNQGVLPVNIVNYNQDGSLAFSILAVYTSEDGGQSWKAAPAVLESKRSQISSVQILTAQTLFSRCDSNLCLTNDGAKTWQTLPDSLNFDQSAGGSDYVSQFTFIDPLNGWAISGETGAAVLWKSSDGGATWNKLSPILVP